MSGAVLSIALLCITIVAFATVVLVKMAEQADEISYLRQRVRELELRLTSRYVCEKFGIHHENGDDGKK